MSTDYSGPERRSRRTYVTRNTEYHFHEGVCVAVRDRRTGRWLSSHLAMRRRVSGGVRHFPNGATVPTERAEIGDALYFAEDGRELITSAVCRVERPSLDVVREYPHP